MSKEQRPVKPVSPGQTIMPLHGTFRFKCGAEVGCFTRCCRDVTIVLTPYDILRLKNRLGLTSEAFIDQFTLPLAGSQSGLPVFILKMGADEQKRCPFVSQEEGCRVYEERPWACRMYPLDTREGDEGEEEYYVTADPNQCLGLAESDTWTTEEWEKGQGLDRYQEIEILFNEITSAQRIWGDHRLDGKVQSMIILSCYNSERFKKFIFESNFLKLFDLPEELVEKIRTDDLELLKLGFKWLQFGLLGKSTLPIREEVIKAKEKEMGFTLPKDDGLWKNPQTTGKKG